MNELVLSIFPGIGLLDMAFEEQGFCIVRGPDVLWGGDIKRFHPPAGHFAGVIGGPPCKPFSSMTPVAKKRYGDKMKPQENLIPEFERCVRESQPAWFLMENVRRAPLPSIEGYAVSPLLLNNRHFGGEQNRVRRLSFGVRGLKPVSLLPFLDCVALEPSKFEYAILAGHGKGGMGLNNHRSPEMARKIKQANRREMERILELQGLPADFLSAAPFTKDGKQQVVGNGVPLPLGRAIAKAVRAVLEQQFSDSAPIAYMDTYRALGGGVG